MVYRDRMVMDQTEIQVDVSRDPDRVFRYRDTTGSVYVYAVAPRDNELAGKYRLERSLEGVVIASVMAGGPAHRVGLDEGDLIVEISCGHPGSSTNRSGT